MLAGEGMYDGVPPGQHHHHRLDAGPCDHDHRLDATVKGGTYYSMMQKHVRAQQVPGAPPALHHAGR